MCTSGPTAAPAVAATAAFKSPSRTEAPRKEGERWEIEKPPWLTAQLGPGSGETHFPGAESGGPVARTKKRSAMDFPSALPPVKPIPTSTLSLPEARAAVLLLAAIANIKRTSAGATSRNPASFRRAVTASFPFVPFRS